MVLTNLVEVHSRIYRGWHDGEYQKYTDWNVYVRKNNYLSPIIKNLELSEKGAHWIAEAINTKLLEEIKNGNRRT